MPIPNFQDNKFLTGQAGGKTGGGYGMPGGGFTSRFDKPSDRGGPMPPQTQGGGRGGPMPPQTQGGGRGGPMPPQQGGGYSAQPFPSQMPPGMGGGGFPMPPMPPNPFAGGGGGMFPGAPQPWMPPGAGNIPGLNGFNNIMFGGGQNPSWEQQFGPGGSIRSQMRPYDGPQRTGAPQGGGQGMQRPPMQY